MKKQRKRSEKLANRVERNAVKKAVKEGNLPPEALEQLDREQSEDRDWPGPT